jgi:hypothetical protein
VRKPLAITFYKIIYPNDAVNRLKGYEMNMEVDKYIIS